MTDFAYRSLLLSVCLLIPKAYGAPIPATSTSLLTSPEHGLFFSVKGFRLGTDGTQWRLQEDHSMNKGEGESSWRFSSGKSPTATANLKTDYLKADLSLEAYAKRWIRDYSQLGLDVLGTRSFAITAGNRGIVIDLLQPKKKLQLRQAVFLKNKSVVILTCSDEQARVDSLISECNQLIKNFSWAETPPVEKKKQ